jgi:hypothetical protein
MLVRRALSSVLAGAIPGILGAQLPGRILESLIQGAKPIGITLSSGLLLLFVLIASVSIWSATRRISTLDVISVLRSE